MFTLIRGQDPKEGVPSLLKLSKLHQDYNMLHMEVRRDINFSSYIGLLGLKGSLHVQHHLGG